ncbi:MAG TPA: CIA30 family protein [Candidatus Goldiibacteriota bacterium]|nr:CIA30 family protein [Candidatus Goldiibacteriota bacterium]
MKKALMIALSILFVVVMIFAGCRKTSSVSISSAEIIPTPVPTTPPLPPKGPMLDDMEIDPQNQNNWGGYWYTYDDLKDGGTSYAVPWSDARCELAGVPVKEFFMQSPGHGGTGMAARVTGEVTTVFTYGFVGIGTGLTDPKGPVDISGCEGIRFWTKGDGKQYRVKIQSVSPLFLLGAGDNYYGYTFTAPADWTQVDVPFTALTQEPYWGTTVALTDSLAMSSDVQFQTVGQPHASINLWVDEIEIYGCPDYNF